MSQAKVDQYKKEKANRKQTLARQKRLRIVGTVCGWLICIGLIGWIGYSGVTYYINTRPAKNIYCDISDLDDYLLSLEPESESE